MKKLLLSTLLISLITVSFNSFVYANSNNNKNLSNKGYGVLNESDPVMVEEFINDDGDKVQHFEDNTQFIYHSGYIPGCKQQHFGLCNAGYWEYSVV